MQCKYRKINGCRPSCRHYLSKGLCVLAIAEQGGMTQREVASVMGMSRSLVYEIEKKALKKMELRLMPEGL